MVDPLTTAVAAPRYPIARRRSRGTLALGLPATLALLVFFVIPVAGMFAVSFAGPTPFASYEKFLSSKAAMTVLKNTVLMAAGVTAICALVAVPFALAVRALPPVWGRVAFAAAVLPLWLSSLVRTYAWLYMLSREGVLNAAISGLGGEPLPLLFNWGAIATGMVHVLLPYMLLPVHNALAAIPPSLPRAAQSLGAGPVRVFLTITLPLMARGLATGSLIVFVVALGFYVTPLMLGGRGNMMLAPYVDTIVNVTLNWPNAAAAAVVLVALVALLLGLGAAVLRLRPGARA